jgi:hypothetical protein
MNALPGQMELATVVDHVKYPANVMDVPVAKVVSKYGDPEAFGEREIELLTDLSNIPYDTNLYLAKQDTHKPAGVRLAKMLSQYDDSPSSQLWGDIQRLAREILK